MFWWIKRKFWKPVMGSVNQSLSHTRVITEHGVMAWSEICADGVTTAVYGKTLPTTYVVGAQNELKALGLVHCIEKSKRQKKKYSHLLAELKALEVKE